MLQRVSPVSEAEVEALLRSKDVIPTTQRVRITQVLMTRCCHLSAEDIFKIVNSEDRQVSKATVYNTLGLLSEKGVIRQVIADPARVFYDPNTAPHHHIFDESTGELVDVDASDVQVSSLPQLPESMTLQGVDVVIRVRRSAG
ncbi:MAG: transcriptional repressor [Pseudomonadota bacterium]|nr:MAG: transcriptional repressor [Pseudomonadota bacterium]